MFVSESKMEFEIPDLQNNPFGFLEEKTKHNGDVIRLIVTKTDAGKWTCECASLEGRLENNVKQPDSIFKFRRRILGGNGDFNAVLIIPTGIGAEIGGHAGDGCVVARSLSPVCDKLITHPNVVNASDINELPENGIYVEGSVLTRFLMGSIGLEPMRANRVLVVVDGYDETGDEQGFRVITEESFNAVNAARATYGFWCSEIISMYPRLSLAVEFSDSGRATGRIEGLKKLCTILEECRSDYDAVALCSHLDYDYEQIVKYYEARGDLLNPWGGAEAMLTHTVSSLFDVQSVHAPMFAASGETPRDFYYWHQGIVDSRMAAEAISATYMQCILKGLQRSPGIVTNPELFSRSDVISAEDVSCLVIPKNCLGLPTLAALYQGVPVIEVGDNTNIMQNDLSVLPWREGQFYSVSNYWEAAGVMSCLRAGIVPESVRRPLAEATIRYL